MMNSGSGQPEPRAQAASAEPKDPTPQQNKARQPEPCSESGAVNVLAAGKKPTQLRIVQLLPSRSMQRHSDWYTSGKELE